MTSSLVLVTGAAGFIGSHLCDRLIAAGHRVPAIDGCVVSNFVTQALAGQPLSIYGDGLQTRSFCFVDDVMRALLALMDADRPGPLNIGDTMEPTMLELAQLVPQVTASRSAMSFLPFPVDDPVRRRPDIGAARAALDWQPAVTLRDGLNRAIWYFRDLGANEGVEAPAARRLPVPAVAPGTAKRRHLAWACDDSTPAAAVHCVEAFTRDVGAGHCWAPVGQSSN
jgi:nucleoside-diphosphate-sugar epimerase